MDNEVKLPIETVRENDKITKTCVEDIYKILNRVIEQMDKSYNNSEDIIDSIHKDYGEWEGELIVGKGVSQPCHEDVFDEKVGNDIAFMKAKLNANIKKHNILCQIWNQYVDMITRLNKELEPIDAYIRMDLCNLRKYNPNYLTGIETKLGV